MVSAQAGLDSILPKNLVDASGSKVSRDTLKGKVIGLYFSASWCPPCRGFTPKLVDFYKDNKTAFEVVLVPADQTEEASMKYMKDYKMDWTALPFGSSDIESLNKKYGITGIPALIIVDSQGNLISKEGRAEVMEDPSGALKAWQAKAKS